MDRRQGRSRRYAGDGRWHGGWALQQQLDHLIGRCIPYALTQ